MNLARIKYTFFVYELSMSRFVFLTSVSTPQGSAAVIHLSFVDLVVKVI